MRAMWKGAVSFGLVNVPVRLYAATQEHDIRFHQVHRADGGRIKMRRTCSVCGQEVRYDELAKGYEAEDGRLVVLTDEDLETLPVASSHEIDVVEFVPADQVDPVLFGRSYYLEPEARAVKPYSLLREALAETDRMGIVKVALRQRESLAVLRVRDDTIMLQTLLWPDEVRAPEFEVLDTEVTLRPQELAMASSLIESLSTDFAADAFTDEYQTAMAELVERKLEGAPPAPVAADHDQEGGDVVDLLTALQRSVDRVKGRTVPGDGTEAKTGTTGTAGTKTTGTRTTGTRTTGTKTTGTKTTGTKTTGTKTTGTKTTGAKATGTKTTGTKTTGTKTTGAKTTGTTAASGRRGNRRDAEPAVEATPRKRARKTA